MQAEAVAKKPLSRMRMNAKLGYFLPLLLALGACDDGRITLSVADAPVDQADEVVVQFSSIAFERDDGTRELIEFADPQRVDLRSLTGGASFPLLADRPLPAAGYRAIEFGIDGSPTSTDSAVLLADGSTLPLYVPDTQKSALRVLADFDIREGESVEATVDFDLRASLFFVDGGRAELRPQLRFVIDSETGSVGGRISADLIAAACTPAIYAYSDSDVTPDDIGGSGEAPISSASVSFNTTTGEYRYAVGFLEEGPYTFALTCEAANDDPGEDDDISFTRMRNVTVQADRSVTLNIE